jgi:hypothetical protein
VIDSFAPINPALIDQPPDPSDLTDGHPGYPDDVAAGDTPDVLKECCGEASREFPEKLWIEPKDWPQRARENDINKTWPMNYLDRYTNQSPTHECTTHSLRANVEACRNRQRGVNYGDGPKRDFRYEESSKFGSVWLSPLSVYAEANPRQWGGAGIRQVLEIACRRGMLPEKIQPREYNFKHTLQGTTGKGGTNQSSGPWVRMSNFPAGWEETAKLFKPLEVIFPDSWEQAVCLVLHGYAVSVGRSGHAVPWMVGQFTSNDLQALGYPDSYDVTRYDSLGTVKRAWSGSFAIATVTIPDSWDNPGGIA